MFLAGNKADLADQRKVGAEVKKLCMKKNISKGFSGIGSPTGSQRLTPLRETLIGQRASIAKICEEVGLQKILELPSEDTDIQIHAVKVVANLAAEDFPWHRSVNMHPLFLVDSLKQELQTE